MKYVRKTVDRYDLMVDYGTGFECVTSEETMKEARKRRGEYAENDWDYKAMKIVKRRVKK